MSLEKAIEHGKEHRKPYHGSKAFDSSCRPHGACGVCESNRKHAYRRAALRTANFDDVMVRTSQRNAKLFRRLAISGASLPR